MLWDLNSYDSAASFAEEVQSSRCQDNLSPSEVSSLDWPCVMSFILPVLVVTGATDYDQTDWVDGHLAILTAANDIGGEFLSKWTVFAISYGYPTSLMHTAYQLMGIAWRNEATFLASFFKKRSKFSTPTSNCRDFDWNTCHCYFQRC